MQEVFEKIVEKLEEEKNDLTDWYEDVAFGFGIKRSIEIVKQEAAECNNGWIPCSERLPEENSNVIACFAHGLVTELTFYDGLFHGIYEYTTRVITAWQPLPAPYQPKGD